MHNLHIVKNLHKVRRTTRRLIGQGDKDNYPNDSNCIIASKMSRNSVFHGTISFMVNNDKEYIVKEERENKFDINSKEENDRNR